ncbi:MAG: flagellar export chaperone FliS [Porticoccus sp.]
MYEMRANFGAAAYSGSARAYSNISIESNVMSANPHQLIVLLFDGIDVAIRTARLHMESSNLPAKGKAISKAIDIINQGLIAAIDDDRGGEISQNLGSLYRYVIDILLEANLRNDMEKLDEAAGLLSDIGSAWREIGSQQ